MKMHHIATKIGGIVRGIVFTQVKEFKLDDNKGCFITGIPGTGKTYICKGLQQEILKVSDMVIVIKCVHQHTNQL
jgi:hypothetical protein